MFIFAIIVAVIGLIALAVRGEMAKLAGVGFIALAAIMTTIASVDKVPTKNVGIVTAFSKPTGRTTGAGLKWHAPWQSIDDWDASGQTYAHLGDSCVWLTIAAQRRACIPLQIEWSARAERAPENWSAYKETDGKSRFETWVSRRVDPQINAALTSVFAGFDPLGNVDPKSGDAPAPDLNKTYKQPLLDALNTALGPDASFRSIAFEAPRYDEPTTAAIAAYGQKVLEARNLQIDKANAVTRADITRTDATVDQVARCLQIAEKLGKEPGLCMGSGAVVTRPLDGK